MRRARELLDGGRLELRVDEPDDLAVVAPVGEAESWLTVDAGIGVPSGSRRLADDRGKETGCRFGFGWVQGWRVFPPRRC